ncbi:MAG: BREX-2 system adenine-specific DNA-methyltransferase PglX, partial [Planctomycetaceae bacterium]|nr:BREX-2 system adenine-specific DNA-methyltransferase PglX [Planctomycetaceae bacterium]
MADVQRRTFGKHPWSIGGGGAAELQSEIESQASGRLEDLTVAIGRVAHTGSDEAYVADAPALLRGHVPPENITTFVEGECLRDWVLSEPTFVLFPYGSKLLSVEERPEHSALRWLWPFRDQLWDRREPNGTHREIGKTWYEFSRFHPERYMGPAIAFAFVATHNHFVLDHGGKVFKQTAPIIKLPADATKDNHLALLGLLNSSTTCFWMKQVFHDKGNGGIGGGIGDEEWERRFEHDGTKIQAFPVPERRQETIALSRELNALAREIVQLSPAELVQCKVPTGLTLEANRRETERLQAHMVALQEELDWLCYRLYGLLDADDPAVGHPDTWAQVPGLALGQRAFEIVLARKVAAGEVQTAWFERHGSTPITEIPDAPGAPVACHPETEGDEGRRIQGRHAEVYPTKATDSDGSHGWPEWYRERVARRIERIESDPNIGLIER